jgi:isocitrate dehydrogenase kinase/phosphatase
MNDTNALPAESAVEPAPAPVTPPPAPASLARDAAREIADAFERYNAEYRQITRRAPQRFDSLDWQGAQKDAVERIELYGRYVDSTVAAMRVHLGPEAQERFLWAEIKRRFEEIIAPHPDSEFRKTFFNSIGRTFFGTVGVDSAIEFVALDLDPLSKTAEYDFLTTYANRGSLELLFEEILADFRTHAPWRDFDRSVRQIAAEVEKRSALAGERRQPTHVEMIRQPFYQLTRVYLVGRIVGRDWSMPLAIALKNTERGLLVDALMTTVDDLSILFSFTRSYFHVDLEYVGKAVLFLKQLMPHKAVSELFIVIGRAKQGKTERYRELFRHLQTTDDRFVHAPGERGLVMVCFTLPSFDVVFKLIRDHFPVQKNILRSDVLLKYDLVFKRDRAGRLVDAQEFKRLRFPKDRFAPELLEELLTETAGTVHVEGDDLIIDHCYIERRMTPLNLYIRNATPEQAEQAVLDYGQAIRDLAYTNIFAGDLLLKNFGVTRHGRVIFYDYDELCLITDCRFRDLPQAESYEDEMRAETWYYVADNDVFPETFINFLGFDDRLKAAFMATHGEILTAEWWRGVQEKLKGSEVLEVLPYAAHRVRVASSY